MVVIFGFLILIPPQKLKINSIWLKFLKRYLGVPYNTSSSIVYFITNSIPLSVTLEHLASNSFLTTSFPECFNGFQLSPPPPRTEFSAIPDIPTYFWRSLQIIRLPLNPFHRCALCFSTMDLFDPHMCSINKFHPLNLDSCIQIL